MGNSVRKEPGKGVRNRRLGPTAFQVVPLVLLVGVSLHGAFTPRADWGLLGRGYVVRLDLDEIRRLSETRERQRLVVAEKSAAPLGAEPSASADRGEDLAAVAVPLTLTQAPEVITDSAGAASGHSNPAAQTLSSWDLPPDFSLSASPDQANTLEVAKLLRFEDRELGVLSVRIDEASRIFVSRNELARLLPVGTSLPTGAAGGYILLRDLRSSGMDLRYDPVSDELVLHD